MTAGRITIDGHDIRDVQLESLRRAVGVVQQDTFMFTSSIENNVAYGDPWAETETIHSATTEAQLHDLVKRLPREYETLFTGERGVSLSGKQRQRLSIARSLMLNPRIINFDDSTAAIGAATEQRITAALREITSERAVIIISHRLSSLMHVNEILFIDNGQIVERGSHEELMVIAHRLATIRGANRIVVLQDGQIIEEGNPDQLMRNGGLYAHLYSMNYASFDDIPDELIEAAIHDGESRLT